MGDPSDTLRDALADRYRLERELGRGGMATVYLAQDLRHDRPVALKVLHPELARSLGPDRFLREIKLAARLQHPHILSVYDSGESGGQLWFTMPFVEGESLRGRLDRESQLPVEDAVRIAREAAEALEYAHRQGVIHRDIKPENILLSGEHALVADFGIARALAAESAEQSRLTETGTTLGTPAYMSPEQAAGARSLDARSDVYSLATVLWEMLAGEPPFTAATPQAAIARRFTEVPRPLRAVRRHRARARREGGRQGALEVAGRPVLLRAQVRQGARGARADGVRGRAGQAAHTATAPSPCSGSASCSDSACCSAGSGGTRTTRPRAGAAPVPAPAPSGSPCSRSRTWATPPTGISPTG